MPDALTSQEELLPFLLNPHSYAHRPRTVRLVQTHASFVFIAPPFVFKVKKPVNFGFLNFSTLEKRRHFCEREVALNRPRAASELRDIIGSNLEELQRLSTIVNDMLFLSNADRGSRARRDAVTSLAALVGEVIEYHDASVQDAGLLVRLEGDAAGAFDTALLRRAVSNLLGNATRYATKRSTILVAITPVPRARVRLSVSNEGQVIAAQHMPRLFDRFYRAEAARQHSGINHGLGLAIVAAIARMHGGEPFALSANGRTTVGIEIEVAAV